MADCPRCRGRMTPGYLFNPDTGSRIRWLDGEAPGLWRALAASIGIGHKPSDLASRRCGACGFVELFADPAGKPVRTLSSIDGETVQLRGLIATMQDRLAVLETIATDPAGRTAREIERLREPPPDRGEGD